MGLCFLLTLSLFASPAAQEGTAGVPRADGDLFTSGGVRELLLRAPQGTVTRTFRLDHPGESGPPLGLVRWVVGPDPESPGDGLRIERETSFPGDDVRVLHTERLRPRERKLVWREVRPAGGRTVLVERRPGVPAQVQETGSGRVLRRDLARPRRSILLPLHLIELARAGLDLAGPFRVFQPLGGGVETLVARTDRPPLPIPVPLPVRVLSLACDDGSEAGLYVFLGDDLVGFRLQAGGPWARSIPEERHRALARLDSEHG